MSHGFGNNIEIRHRSLSVIAEFEQSGVDRPALICPRILIINLRGSVLGKNLWDSGDELGPNREQPKLHTSPALVLVLYSFKPRPPVDTF